MFKESPLKIYKRQVRSGKIKQDPSQAKTLKQLNLLYNQLKVPDQEQLTRGIYIWGKVGRGKTFLMDLFTGCFSDQFVFRQHFHHFMSDVHNQLRVLDGTTDPLKTIAERFSKQFKLLCFDEFFVSDIADAMLLGRLMQHLFDLQVVLVATSNIAPEDLYKDGLQRQRFLPAIKSIQVHTETIHLAGPTDHRQDQENPVPIYFLQKDLNLTIHSDTIQQPIHQIINAQLLPVAKSRNIEILGRKIPFYSKSDSCIWFSFSHLCEGPRSQLDYIQIAQQFDTLILTDVPPFNGDVYEHIKARGTEDGSSGSTGDREVLLNRMDDAVRRFIALVDELYECRVNLYLSSCIPFEHIYSEGSLLFEFERTRSRLVEMGSKDYLEA